MNRRSFARLAGSACLAGGLSLPEFQMDAQADTLKRAVPRLGLVAKVGPGETADSTIRHVHDLGFPTCQIFYDTLSLPEAPALLEALKKYNVEVSAVSEHTPRPPRL